jgi:hypothetical protein
MDEGQWLACEDPRPMLEYLTGRASDRKLRLFACACCRRIWHLLTDERSRRAVDVAEAFADGAAGEGELEAARIEARAAVRLTAGRDYPSSYQRGVAQTAAEAAAGVTGKKVAKVACTLARAAAEAAAGEAGLEGARGGNYARARAAKLAAESDGHRALLAECFGPLPFRPVAISPAWLSWSGGLVIRLAQDAYEERHLPAGTLDNERLAVLADALEEAGCTEETILGHLRGGGDHVRGCWVIDLLLGEE